MAVGDLDVTPALQWREHHEQIGQTSAIVGARHSPDAGELPLGVVSSLPADNAEMNPCAHSCRMIDRKIEMRFAHE